MYGDKSPPPAFEDPIPLGLQALSIGVRLVGIVVLLVGLWAGVRIILEAFALYQEPARIERFAQAIQAGSNIDGLLGSAIDKALDAEATPAAGTPPQGRDTGLRVSYFAAWMIVLLLMFVIGILAMNAITTGGQLVLYDLQVRRYSRAMVREWRRSQREG